MAPNTEKKKKIGPPNCQKKKFIEKDPDCEEIYRALMRLQGKSGNRTGMRRTFQQLIQVLHDLDAGEPSQETRDLYTQIM